MLSLFPFCTLHLFVSPAHLIALDFIALTPVLSGKEYKWSKNYEERAGIAQ
jgi:hypothetical protein